jgi:hypothetical protein
LDSSLGLALCIAASVSVRSVFSRSRLSANGIIEVALSVVFAGLGLGGLHKVLLDLCKVVLKSGANRRI